METSKGAFMLFTIYDSIIHIVQVDVIHRTLSTIKYNNVRARVDVNYSYMVSGNRERVVEHDQVKRTPRSSHFKKSSDKLYCRRYR